MSLLTWIVLVRLGTVRAANVGVGIVEIGLRCTILRLWVDIRAVGWGR
jgi:hypothetical protein